MSQKRHLNSKNQGQMQETSFKSEKGDIAESSRLLSRTKATLYVNYILMPVIVVIIAGLLTYFASKNTDSQTSGASRAKKPKSNVLFTVEELAKHDGSDPNIPIYIAILGRVYNVDKGRRHYTIGSGYNVFAGRDSTPSFVTGLFSREKATDNVKGMTPEDMLGIKDWLDFYRRDYTYVGKLIGRYYDHDGNPTQALKEAKVLIKEGQRLKKLQEDENKRFPGCNSKWSIEEGSMVWCSKNRY